MFQISRKNLSRGYNSEPEYERSRFFPPQLQAKLNINEPGDVYEQEADAVADKVMRMQDTAGLNETFFKPAISVYRKCAACEAEDEQLHLKENDSKPSVDATTETYIHSLSGGQSLNEKESGFFEPRMGYDFSQVRLHTDAAANQSAKGIDALAYTHGNNIVFAGGQYEPETDAGKRLLAHELTHVVQQSDNIGADGIRRAGRLGHIFLKPDTKKEEEETKKSIEKKDWTNAYVVLNKQDMEVLLGLLENFDIAIINELLSNSDAVVAGPAIAKAGKEKVVAALFTVATTKATGSAWDFLTLAFAAGAISALSFADRLKVIEYLKKHKASSAIAKLLYEQISKPLWNYGAAGLDFSDRFLRHSGKLGFTVKGSQDNLTEFNPDPYTENQPDTVTDPATALFEQSDILFFSGHQYAQYHEPGVFTNEASEACFNIGAIKKPLAKVKLIVSTGCATICKDTARIFNNKFPNAMVLGYRLSAPADGSVIANSFAATLATKGPVDLSDDKSKSVLKDTWKAITNTGQSASGQPGILYNGNVEFWNGKKWETATWDNKENECHYH